LSLSAISVAPREECARAGLVLGVRAQTDAFQHRVFHLGIRALVIAALGVQRAITAAGFAVIFLVTFVIMAVSHHMFTAAFRARVRYNCPYHEKVLQVDLSVYPGLPFHALSVKTSPLPISHVSQ
jgi:hypothetical protein